MDDPCVYKYKSCKFSESVFGKLDDQSQETQQEGRKQGPLPGNLSRAVGAGVGAGVSGGGFVAGSLDDVGIRSTINEGSSTGCLQGVGIALVKERGEIGLEDIVKLLNARSAEVDAVEGAVLAAGNLGKDHNELVDSQGTRNRLNVGKGLGDAELVLRSIGKTKGLPYSGINLLNDGDNGTGRGVAELKVCGAASGNVGDNEGKVIIGARPARTETLQPGIDGGNDGTVDPLHEDLEKITGIETRGPRVSSDGNDGALTLGGNTTGLSECAANHGGNK